jgi:hypothetical protein
MRGETAGRVEAGCSGEGDWRGTHQRMTVFHYTSISTSMTFYTLIRVKNVKIQSNEKNISQIPVEGQPNKICD